MTTLQRTAPMILALLLLAGCATSDAPPEGPGEWRLLGETRLKTRADRTEIVIREAVRVSAIQLKARGRALKDVILTLRFVRGDVQDVQVRRVIQPGSPSREVVLPVPQVIERAEMIFEPEGRTAGRASVQLYGRLE